MLLCENLSDHSERYSIFYFICKNIIFYWLKYGVFICKHMLFVIARRFFFNIIMDKTIVYTSRNPKMMSKPVSCFVCLWFVVPSFVANQCLTLIFMRHIWLVLTFQLAVVPKAKHLQSSRSQQVLLPGPISSLEYLQPVTGVVSCHFIWCVLVTLC